MDPNPREAHLHVAGAPTALGCAGPFTGGLDTTEKDLKSSRLAREWSLNDQPWLSPDGHIAKKPAQYFSLLRPIYAASRRRSRDSVV